MVGILFSGKGKTKGETALDRELQGTKKEEITKQKKEKRRVKRSTIQTIPYIKMCENDILMIKKDTYSKTFKFLDINYSNMKREDQETIFLSYVKILNYFNFNVDVQISIINSELDLNEFNERVLFDTKDNDIFGIFKNEYNQIIGDILSSRDNKIVMDKFITITMEYKDFGVVKGEFIKIENFLKNGFKKIDSELTVLDNNEKCKLLKKIFRDVDTKVPEFTQKDFDKQYEKNFISPDYFVFRPKYSMFDDTYSESLILRNLPSHILDSFIEQLSSMEANLNISININPVSPAIATKLISRRIASLESDKLRYIESSRKKKLPVVMLPRDLEHSLEEADELSNNLIKNNEKVFLVSVIVTVFAYDLDELNLLVKDIKGIANQNICTFSELYLQQEEALMTTLPIGNNFFKDKRYQRTLTSNSTAIFLPFSYQSLYNADNGIFYGVQPDSKEVIFANRKKLVNPHGFILGTSGSGKSVSAKDEISQVLWRFKDDDVIVIDPQAEYMELAKLYNGQGIRIALDTDNYINPLEISNGNFSNHTVAQKVSTLITIFEMATGEISHYERSIIDRVLVLLYKKAIEQQAVPTIQHFYHLLKIQNDELCNQLATKIELFCVGTQNIFAHQTNININNRFLVYDIKDLNPILKEIAYFIMFENIVERIYSNRNKGKFTWLFIDEMHTLLKLESSALYLEKQYKESRKFNGVITCMTQNITEILDSSVGSRMLSNAEYTKILKQKYQDKERIIEILNISKNQAQYIDDTADTGCGLLVWGKTRIPFESKLPEKSMLLKIWGTSPSQSIVSNF